MDASWSHGLELFSYWSLESVGLALPLCSALVSPSSLFDLGRRQGSSHWLSMVPQGWVPWLPGQHWHQGHVLHELGSQHCWFNQSLRRRSAVTHGQRGRKLAYLHVVAGIFPES